MVVSASLSKPITQRLAWKIVLDVKVNHQDAVASLCRDQGESFVLEELRLQELKMASPRLKLDRFTTFKAKWIAYAVELGLECDTTASLNGMQEQLLTGAWTWPLGQDEVLQILKALGDHATVPQMREYAKKHYPGTSMTTDTKHFYNKLNSLRKKWGLVAAIFDKSLPPRGLLVYYLIQGRWRPPNSPNFIKYPYRIRGQDSEPDPCHIAISAIRGVASTSANHAKDTWKHWPVYQSNIETSLKLLNEAIVTGNRRIRTVWRSFVNLVINRYLIPIHSATNAEQPSPRPHLPLKSIRTSKPRSVILTLS
jgi:hypothetical protein